MARFQPEKGIQTPVLHDSTQWKDWYYQLKATAVTAKVWDVINPALDTQPALQKKPTIPPAPEYHYTNGTVSNPQLATVWQQQFAAYQEQDRQYEKQQAGLQLVEDFLLHTLPKKNRVFLDDKTTVYDKLKELKKRLAPNPVLQKLMARKKLQSVTTIGSEDPAKWLDRFKTAIAEAESVSLADTQLGGDSELFLSAVAPLNPTFAQMERKGIRDLVLAGHDPPSVDDLMARWEYDLRENEALQGSKFALASFKGDKQPTNNQHEASSTRSSTTNGSQENGNGKGNNSDYERHKCHCGIFHRGPRYGLAPHVLCRILNSSIRPEGWSLATIGEFRRKNAEEAVKDAELVKKIKKDCLEYAKKAAASKDQEKDKTKEGGKSKEVENFVFTTVQVRLPPALTGRTDEPEDEVFVPPEEPKIYSTTTDVIFRDSTILDSGANTHIANNLEGFTKTREARPDDKIGAGLSTEYISFFGTRTITIDGEKGKVTLTLTNVAYIPTYNVNIVSADVLEKKGVFYNSEERYVYVKETRKIVGRLTNEHGLRFFVYNPKDLPNNESLALVSIQTSKEPKPTRVATAAMWHTTMGHSSKEPLRKLQEATIGASVTDIDTAPTTNECEPCALAKARHVVSRRSTHQEERSGPFERVSFDLIPMERSHDGMEWCSHLVCLATKYTLLKNHKTKAQAVRVLEEFLMVIFVRWGIRVVFVKTDDEQALGFYFEDMKSTYGFTSERNAPYSSEQNGPAEKSGDIITTKGRTMRIAAGIPSRFWPVILEAAAYITNRTPTKALGWKTPFEAVTGKKPTVSHMRVYGCNAYPLIPEALRLKKQRLDPRAYVGYLVGYDSTNIYKVWVPSKNRVLRVRDVTFDESQLYDYLDPDMAEIEETREMVSLLEIGEAEAAAERKIDPFADWFSLSNVASIDVRSNVASIDVRPKPTEQPKKQADKASSTGKQLPTPDSTPQSTPQPEPDPDPNEDDFDDGDGPLPWEEEEKVPERSDVGLHNVVTGKRVRKEKKLFGAVTCAQTPSPFKEFNLAFSSALRAPKKSRRHVSEMPDAPKNWKQAMASIYAADWKAAARREIGDLEERKAWQWIQIKTISMSDQILPQRWVFTYKLDEDGFLLSFKARVVVRGDLQTTNDETYAATLASKQFRSLIAIAAAWDMDLWQRDAVKAFTNAIQPGKVYCYAPEGFEKSGWIVLLGRAMYGLKTSPNLWYNDFTYSLEKLGLQRVPGAPCVYQNDSLMCHFCVDDVIEASMPKYRRQLQEFDDQLGAIYEMHHVGELKWFLSINVIRDRKVRKIYLNQASYAEGLIEKFGLDKDRCPKSPMSIVELLPNSGEAPEHHVKLYQSKVGSINFPSVMTRPDLAFTASRLSQFLTNPSAQHMEAADRAIRYFYGSRNLALVYNGSDHQHEAFECASDASFADDSITRKSSAGFVFKLFGAAVDWKAYKQSTVTTSSTEAELLAISSAAKETMAWIRYFEAIGLDLEHKVGLACDNQQTVNMLLKQEPKLNTRLRHVDIHNHWLRQEVEKGTVLPYWVGTKQMMADGFTKPLPKDGHNEFCRMLGLEDITELLENDKDKKDNGATTTKKGTSTKGQGMDHGSAG